MTAKATDLPALAIPSRYERLCGKEGVVPVFTPRTTHGYHSDQSWKKTRKRPGTRIGEEMVVGSVQSGK